MLVSSTGSKLLPDHQEACRPVADPQEAGPEQHAALLYSRAVCGRRAADAQELCNLQLRESNSSLASEVRCTHDMF